MVTIEKILFEMQKFYIENGKNRSIDYDYGFMDALSVLRDMQQEERIND